MCIRDRSYEHVPIDIHTGDTQTAEYKAKNPVGQIPLLELADGRVLAESNAILFFLAEGTPYWPKNAFDQAQVLRWMFFEQYKHEPSIAVARFIRMYAVESRADQLEALMPKGYAALDVMEDHLSTHHWFVGAGPSIADISLYAYTHVAGDGGFDLSAYPNITAWVLRVADHPKHCLLYTSPSPRDATLSRMPSSA